MKNVGTTHFFSIIHKLQGVLVFSAVILSAVLVAVIFSHTIRTDSQISQSEKNSPAVGTKETIQLSSQPQNVHLEVQQSNQSQFQSVYNDNPQQDPPQQNQPVGAPEPQQVDQVQPLLEEAETQTNTFESQIVYSNTELDNQPTAGSTVISQQDQNQQQVANYYVGSGGSSQQKPSSSQGKSSDESQQTQEEDTQQTNQQSNTEDSGSDSDQQVVVNEPEQQPAPLKIEAVEEEVTPTPQNSQPTQQPTDTSDSQATPQPAEQEPTRQDVIDEWDPKVKEMREMNVQAKAMIDEAKEFVKMWDETPAVYANAIEQAERYFLDLDMSYVDKNYDKLKNNPTSQTTLERMQSHERVFPVAFNDVEDALETLLSTARQPTVQEQCDRPGIECQFFGGNNYMTRSQYAYTMSDGTKVVIKYYPSGEIKQYNEYHPYSSQKQMEVNYRDPASYDSNSFKKWTRGVPSSEKAWYSDGQIAFERAYYNVELGRQRLLKHAEKAYRTDGNVVYHITIFDSDRNGNNNPMTGFYTYPDGSRKSTYVSGELTCYEDGTGSTQGNAEPCTKFHTMPQY